MTSMLEGPLLAWLLTYAIHSTVLLTGVWALDRYVAVPNRWRDTLWKAALLGGVFTSIAQSVVQASPTGEAFFLNAAVEAPFEANAAATVDVPDGFAVAREPRGSFLDEPHEVDGGVVATTDAEIATTDRSTQPFGPAFPFSVVISLLWMGAALVLMGRVVTGHLRVMRALGRRQGCEDPNLVSALNTVRVELGVRRPVRLSVLAGLPTPLALGRSEVVLPAKAVSTLSTDEIRAAFAHEMAHLLRADPLWRMVSASLSSIFFFQPLNRVAARRLASVSEALSDEWAVRVTGSPIPLARCLTAVAEWVAPSGRFPIAAAVPMAVDQSELTYRIERVLRNQVDRATDPKGLRASAALGLVLVVGLTGPRVASEPRPGDARDAAVPGRVIEPASTDVETFADRSTVELDEANFASTTSAPEEGSPTPSPVATPPDTVIHHPNPTEPLVDRWAWALREGSTRRIGEVWIAYRVASPLPQGASWSQHWGGVRTEQSLNNLFGDSGGDQTNVYMLLQVKPSRDGTATLTAVAGQSVNLGGFDFAERRVYWLGQADPEEGVDLLIGLYEHDSAVIRSELVESIGMHRHASVGPFLMGVLGGREVEVVREEAAESLEYHSNPRVIQALAEAAFEDPSRKVRSEAAETLGDIPEPAARAALIDIASNGPIDSALEAVEGLESSLDPETFRALDEILNGSADTRLQRETVEALANMRTDAALELLERALREHPKSSIRSEAAERLLEIDPGRARDVLHNTGSGEAGRTMRLEAIEAISRGREEGPGQAELDLLLEVALNDPDSDVQREAVEALGEFGTDAAHPLLRVAHSHPETRIRVQAAESLGELPPETALRALDEIITEHDDERVVRQAVESLGEVGTEKAYSRLREVAASHRFRSARQEARDQLGRDD